MTRAGCRAGRRTARAAATAVVLLVLTGCGASPKAIGPSGVDGLTIPTPSADPADFPSGRSAATNPWFPLVPGTVWTYRRDTASGTDHVRATVLPQSRGIAGVATTAVQWDVVRHGRTLPVVTRWYAVDGAGNVWWFGQEVRRRGLLVDSLVRRSWLAGRDGAEAGLLVPAEPRVGDGYANAAAPGAVQRRSTVVSVTASVATAHRTYRDTLMTRDLSSLEPTHVEQSFYARGIGLVAQQTTQVTVSDVSLTSVHRP